MTKFRYYFAESSNFEPVEEGVCIYVYPTSINWNDFQYRTVFEVKVFSIGELIYKSEDFVKIIFPNDDYETLFQEKNIIRIKDVKIDFVSLVSESKGYQGILEILGLKRTINFFSKLKDATILKLISEDYSPTTNEAHDAFYKSLTRYSEAFSLYNGSTSIFNMSIKNFQPFLQYSFKLDGFTNKHSFDLNFDTNPFMINRLNILVGKNGSGKSQSLSHICRGEIEKILECNGIQLENVFNRVIAIANSVEDAFPKISDLNQHSGIFYRYINLLKKDEKNSITQSVMNIVRQNDYFGEDLKIEILKKSLKGIVDYEDIWIPLKKGSYSFPTEVHNGRRFFPVRLYKNLNEERQLLLTANIDALSQPVLVAGEFVDEAIQLSTGQYFFFNAALKVLNYISNKSLLLFDEPETYLHPNLEIDFFKLVNEILNLTDSYGVFSTHSVFMVREVMNSQIKVFEKKENEIFIYSPVIQTFGSSLDLISDYIFGDFNKQKFYENILLKNSKITKDNYREYSKYLGDDALFYLVNRIENEKN